MVDDNHRTRTIIAAQLLKSGHDVQATETGEEAVERAAKVRFDLVLMDCHTPGMDGIEATRRIRASERETSTRTAIIGFTADATEGTLARCRDAGMDSILTKPCTFEDLEKAIAQILADARPEN